MSHNNRPHILCFMADPSIRNGGTKRYLEHASKFTTWAQVTVLTNRQLQLSSLPVRRIDICNRSTRPLCGWMVYFWWILRNVTNAHIGTVDYILIYGSNNILAAARLKRKTKAVLIFDPRQNDIACLRMQYHGATRAPSHHHHIKRLLLWIQMRLRIVVQQFLYIVIAKCADLVLFQTDYELEIHRNQMPIMPHNMAVLPNSIDTGHEPPSLQPFDSTPRSGTATTSKPLQVLFCGTLMIRKGIWETIDAILQLWSQNAPISLSVLGDGVERASINRYLRSHALTATAMGTRPDEHIHYCNAQHRKWSISLYGWVTTPQTYFLTSDIIVVPSHVEAFPDVILEALQVNTPVIASDIPNIRYMLHHDDLLFAARSSGALAAKLLELVNHPDTIDRYRALCHSRTSYFSFDYSARFQKIIRTHVAAQ